MQNFMKTIISAIQHWTKKQIKDSVADWNQNDRNADNYIKNRTHYEEIKSVTLVDNLTSEDYENGNAPACNFIPGNTYDVTWNGVLYEGLVCIFDGEYNVIQASTGEELPFYIDDDGGNSLCVESNEDVSNWTVLVVSKNSVVHKIDKKFLPDDIGGKPDWNENDPESSGYIKNRPFYTAEDWYTYAPRQTITFEDGRCELTDYTGWPDVGQSFKIIFDDIEYTGTVWEDGDACYRLDFVTDDGIQVLFYDGYRLIANLNGNHTIEIYLWGESVTPLPEKYLPHRYMTEDNLSDALDEQLDEKLDEKLEDKMDKRNPEGSGIFRLNSRDDIDIIGDNSTSIGTGTLAGTAHSFVTGTYNKGTLGEYMEKTESYSSHTSRNTKVYFSDEYVFDGLTGIYTLVNAQYGTMSYSNSNVGLQWGKYMQYEDEKDSQKMRYVNSSLLNQAADSIRHSGTLYTSQPLRSDKKGKYVVVVGNGSTEEALSDAHTLDWNGNAWYAGDVYVGSTSGTDKDEGSKKLATEEYVKAYVESYITEALSLLRAAGESE